MELVENEDVPVSHATSAHLKPLNVNRYSSDSGVVDVDLRPLDMAEMHRLSAAGTGRSRPHSVRNSIAGMYSVGGRVVVVNCKCY